MKKILISSLVLIIIAVVAFIFLNKFKNAEGSESLSSGKTLVAYFSATGTTKHVAENLAKAADADIYEIKPMQPYTKEDLNWRDENSRSSMDKNPKNRPELSKDDFSVAEYDKIFLGFPIWWHSAPRIINTFLENQDFSNKKIILFATSGGSGFESTIDDIKPSVSNTTKVIEGKVFDPYISVEELKKWITRIK